MFMIPVLVSPVHDIVLHYLSITFNSNKHDKDKDLCMFNLSGQIAVSLVILASCNRTHGTQLQCHLTLVQNDEPNTHLRLGIIHENQPDLL